MYFDQLNLSDNILDALYDMHFDECTPVQEKCIPEILNGHDVLGVAQTGTGKTAAYLLPVLSMLDTGKYPEEAINCVVMAPTRELAQQIDRAMQGFAYYTPGVSSVAVYGGNDGNRYDQETKGLRLGTDVVIATPGRLISHINMGNADLSHTSFFILDEADRMLDMGFSEDIMSIASHLPKTCQVIMFSATMPDKIEQLAQTLMKNPVEIKLAVSKPAEKIKQSAYVCYEAQKIKIITAIFKADPTLRRVLIFCGKKTKVKEVARTLQRLHINAGEMHSDLDQAQRDEMMFQFKSGQIDVLVATDILSRGIDIDDITMVINYDVPHDAEDYVHRIGRTARADKDGIAITFVAADDIPYFRDIEHFLGKEIDKTALPEGIGTGPEYQTVHKKAKTIRRENRDHSSHKDTKSRNRRNSRQDKPQKASTANKQTEGSNQPSGTTQTDRQQGQTEQQQVQAGKDNGKKPSRSVNRKQTSSSSQLTDRQQTCSQRENASNQTSPNDQIHQNRQKRRKYNGRTQGNDSNRDNQRQASRHKQQDTEKLRDNHSQRQGQTRQRQRQAEQKQGQHGQKVTRQHAVSSPSQAASTPTKQSAISRFFKKPMKWLKSKF